MRHAMNMLAGAALALATGLGAMADPVRIGFNVPLTAFAAANGRSALERARLAIEQVNAAGGNCGETVELVVHDDQASPVKAAALAARMTAQD